MQKKRFGFLLCLFFFIYSLPAEAYFYAYKLPNRDQGWSTLRYEKYESTIEIQGLFYQTTTHFRVKFGKNWYQNIYCNLPDPGNWEYNWVFKLPEESFITGVQLWDETTEKFIQAEVLQRSEAEANYDPNSASTPLVLLREFRARTSTGSWDHFYCLNAGPVDRDASVELKIQYLTPCEMYWDARRIHIQPLTFYHNYNTSCDENNVPIDLRVLDYDHPDQMPKNLYEIVANWENKDGFWWTQTPLDNKLFSNESIFSVLLETEAGQFFQTFHDDAYQFYQLAMLPQISEAERPGRHIILALDLIEQEREYKYKTNRNILLDRLLWPLLISFTEKDSAAFLVSDFNTRWLDKTFVPYSKSWIYERMAQIKQIIPQMNTLPFMLKEAVRFLNEKQVAGEIWLVSNDYSHGSPAATAMEIVEQTYFRAEYPLKFRIIDAAVYYNSYSVNKTYYDGNEYLYENLYRLSKGSLTSLRDYYYYDWGDQCVACLAPTVSTVEIDPIPADGLSYSRVDLNRWRKNFNITSRYYQIGMFDGETPFSLKYYGNYLNDAYNKTFTLEENQAEISNEMRGWVRQYWFANYLVSELLLQPQSYETIKCIENFSAEYQVLTPYSAFVIPGPDGYAGFLKLNAEDSILVELPPAEEEPLPTELTLKAYPNPFNPHTTISLAWPDAFAGTVQVKIFNLLGQVVRTVDLDLDGTNFHQNVVWDGLDETGLPVVSGTYFVHFKMGKQTRNLKILLLR